MKKTRAKRGCQIIDLYPPVRQCQACGGVLIEAYRQSRFVVTLTGGVRLIKHVLSCTMPTCPQRGISERPIDEGRWSLPRYTFGMDVIAYVGELRYQRQRTLPEIHTALSQQQVSISLKEVQLLSEVFLALVQTVIADDTQALAQLHAQGGIILSADGIQRKATRPYGACAMSDRSASWWHAICCRAAPPNSRRSLNKSNNSACRS